MRILIVKTSSLGDVIHQCPAVTDTRRNFPGAVIDWVVEESFADIVRLHPAVRRTIPVALRRWRSHFFRRSAWAELRAFDRDLRAEHYDLVIDTQGLLKSALISLRAHGVSHGYDSNSARESIAARFYDFRHPVPRMAHAVDRNRALTAAALGSSPPIGCEYGIASNGEIAIPVAHPFCVLLTMTSRAEKLWPDSYWAGLIKAIASLGLESVLPWGTDAEQARCARIVQMAGSGIVPRAQSLIELANLLSGSTFVVGVDTGLTHLAVALGRPAVGLYVRTDPAFTGLHGDTKCRNLGGPASLPTIDDALGALKAVM